MWRTRGVRSVVAMSEVKTDFQHLTDAKYILLTTFRRDGTPVATPLWHVVVDGVVYTSTGANLGKVKRIRNNPDVTISACTLNGRPTGPAYAARARLLSGAESRWANRRKRNRYLLGFLVHGFERIVHRQTFVGIAIEPADRIS
jgi:PPOX class probable F420-dependent enzyme